MVAKWGEWTAKTTGELFAVIEALPILIVVAVIQVDIFFNS
jgi:hypothetical protein